MRERKFIKLRVDMYDDIKFKIIDRKPERDLIHYVWSRLVILAGKVNLCGELYFSKTTPYTIETLAIEFNRDEDQIKIALDVLIELEMIELSDHNVYIVKNFAKHQNIKVKENTREISKVEEVRKEDTDKSPQIKEIIYPKEEMTLVYNAEENCEENEKIAQINELKNDSKISTDRDNNGGIKINDTTTSPNAIEDDSRTVLNINEKKRKNIKSNSIEVKDENPDDECIITITEGEFVLPKDQQLIKSWTFS